MTHAEYRYRLLLTASVALLIVSLFALLTGSDYVGDLFVTVAVLIVGAVVVMPAPRRK